MSTTHTKRNRDNGPSTVNIVLKSGLLIDGEKLLEQ
jgi:hypothetical protein